MCRVRARHSAYKQSLAQTLATVSFLFCCTGALMFHDLSAFDILPLHLTCSAVQVPGCTPNLLKQRLYNQRHHLLTYCSCFVTVF
jgi:hypothetical protein